MTTATLYTCPREGCQGGGRAEAGETPTAELPGSGKGAFPSREALGSPARAQPRRFHPPSISLQGCHWEEIWAGLCPAGMGMLQHHKRAGKPRLAPAQAGKPWHVPYRHRRGRQDKPRGLGPCGRCPSKPPQGSQHDPPPRDLGTTRAEPLHCPASPASLCHPPKALPGGPTGCGGLAPSPGVALPSCGSPKTNPCFPKGQIPAANPGQRFSSSRPQISASNYRHEEPASAAGRPA